MAGFKPDRKNCLTLLFPIFVLAVRFFSGGSAWGQESEQKPGTQIEREHPTADGGTVKYLLYLPRAYQPDSGERFPVMLFLHGRGESDGPLAIVAKWGPPMMAARGDDLPFIIVSPQCPRDDNWSSDVQQNRLKELLDSVLRDLACDESKILLTGLSMGGYGSWTMAARHPDRFASVVPVCGGGRVEDAEKLKNVPIWAFHGSEDKVVPVGKSKDMVEAIRRAGGDQVRLTVLEHFGHNSWSPVYASPDVYHWMMNARENR